MYSNSSGNSGNGALPWWWLPARSCAPRPQDSLIINILSVFAEVERELIRDQTAEVSAALKRQGKRVGGAVPCGYDADPFTLQLVVNGEEARQVREMFTMAPEGRRRSQIARSANRFVKTKGLTSEIESPQKQRFSAPSWPIGPLLPLSGCLSASRRLNQGLTSTPT
jgi:hypothetical protein